MRDLFIFGVGRSGTTMLYSLCQKIFQDQYGKAFRSIYEPFIWNPELFDKPYEECGPLFGKTASLHIEGIYNHLKTPMFLSQDLEISGLDNDFFKRFAPADDGTPKLAKIIRGNGRLSLFRKLNPNAKIILIVRNPIDMVNSVKYKFAFFGDDFYPSDFPRFCHELTVLGRLGIDPGSATWAEQQAEYVIQMTRAAMEFASRDPNTLVLEYDRFIADLPHTLQTLLTFLDLSFKDTYLAALKTPVGATTASSVLSEMEFGKIIKYAEAYDGLCRQAGLEQGKSIKDLVDIYKDRYQAGDYDSRLDGLVTNPLRRIVWRLEGRIHQLESKLVSIQASRNWS